MARAERERQNARSKSGKLTYFFLNGKLHKSLHINRGADTITTWCYPDARRVAYTYSDTKQNRKYAFTTPQVCDMLMRGRTIIEMMIVKGHISEPQYSYTLDKKRRKYQYFWSEDNILEAHAYLSTVHRGRPRHDGLITPQRLPTVRELRSMMRHEDEIFVKDSDGEFRPVWRAQDFD